MVVLVRARCEPRARPERVGRRAAARRERAAEPRPGPAREMSQAGWPSARLGARQGLAAMLSRRASRRVGRWAWRWGWRARASWSGGLAG